MDFSHVTVWIFDLDNTLYPPETALFPQIEARMTDYVMDLLGVDRAHADHLRAEYWRQHGTTLAGLMAQHQIDAGDYLARVHDIDFGALRPDPALNDAIAALPGRKIVHTNADAGYAGQVLARRGVSGFDGVYGIAETGFHPKPDARAYDAVLAAADIDPTHAAFFEDDPRNLIVPDVMGMRTVLVGPGRHGPDALPVGTQHGAHVQFQTDDLTAFLRAIVAGRHGG
ncbi:pyrimidine 5'-nucleotidase [Paracoccus sp. (in: a-proteobacteria)]|uniref:pyrimidine 5'-nucleotidase n=1 Tax=Paracoccus sp. TaxID=267 RepID=UPI0026DEBEBA|nr:pyrimidine 5'-nucleotidase [Paracoccus sp. (in: a-proteobacteria)]MDO5647857.1 pyrimidine 5'-nucleotidase [Paracoccus sp. (in: a-proteobacteria)]